jgi:hypothetical protein
MDPASGVVVDAYGQPVQVPPGTMPVPSPQMAPMAPPGGNGVGLLRRQIQGVPVWAILLGVGAVGAGGYYLFTKAKADANSDDDEDSGSVASNPRRSSRSSSSSDDEDSGGSTSSTRSRSRSARSNWSPSRSRVAERAQKWLAKKNQADGTTVIHDADEAMAKGVKNPSPLINLKVRQKSDLEKNADFKRWARREGLDPVRIDKTTIGLVPAQNTKRGVEWEGYIDALREEGQRV